MSSCMFQFCQANSSNNWQAVCQNDTCSCQLNGVELCGCAFAGGQACTQGTGCCFGQ
jgi:hypothetical protein